jgi:two-component system, OmpR family, sensor histidine kinase MprB
MTFRERLTAAAATAVAIAVILASVVTFLVVRAQLRSSMDESLDGIAASAKIVPTGTGLFSVSLRHSAFGGAVGVAQVLGPNGVVERLTGSGTFPATEEADRVAAGEILSLYQDESASGIHLRVYTVRGAGLPPGFALQVARPLTEIDQSLARLLRWLGVVGLVGIAVAGALGYGVSRAAARPITQLTEAAEHVTATGDLSQRIEVPKEDDEVGRLAAAFNRMLAALELSQEAQRRLVADASHELRTPLTSLRTNIDVLAGGRELPAEDRDRLMSDVRVQIAELTDLVGDLVEAGRGAAGAPMEIDDVRLDELVRAAVARASARADARSIRFDTDLEPSLVRGSGSRLERAIVNLLDNAVKFSPDGAVVEVGCTAAGDVTVRDHGPGIAAEDLPHVFDRFYRSDAARGTPGSGLGLAIVKQVAESHGGTVSAETTPDGGALFRLRIPAVPARVTSSPAHAT